MSHLIDWKNVCLVCLQKGENRFIFGEDTDSNVIADKIMKCADISIKIDINQPRNICLQCLDDLNVAYKFRRNCEQSDSIIKSLINTNHKEYQIGDLWKRTPIAVNPTPDICIKDEIPDHAVVDDTCYNKKSLFPIFDDDPAIETKFGVEGRADTYTHSNAMELGNVKADQSNKINQRMNCEISRQLRSPQTARSEEFCDKPRGKSAYKRPLKTCEICNHSFRGQSALDDHIRRHKNDRPFSCDYCDKAFVRAPELRRHVKVHTGQKPYQCQYCDRRFCGYSARKNHERAHTGLKEFVCKECGKGFTKKVLLEKHTAHHLTPEDLHKPSEPKQKKQIEKETLQRDECVKFAEANIKLDIKHEVVVEDLVDCYELGSAMELNNEQTNQSNETKQDANCEISRRLRCPQKTITKEFCDKPSRKTTYKRPLKTCEICNHSFRGQSAFNNHLRRHYNERPFSCDYCEKAFVTAPELRRHVRVHTGQKPYKCQYCDRRFSDYSVRKNHERTHTGEKPYTCPTCGNSFAYSKSLTKHLRLHIGINHFGCKECGKGFMKKILLEKHLAHHLPPAELDKSSEHKQMRRLEKEVFQIEESVDSNEINIKHEVKLIEEELN